MFVTAEALSEWLKSDIDDATAGRHIAIAESMVAAYLGCDDFETRTVSETHRLLYDLDQYDVVEVRQGPISQMLSITVEGSSVALTKFDIGPWTVKRIDGTVLPKNTDLVLNFNAGYDEADSSGGTTMPQRIQDAILVTAGEVFNSPDPQFESERIGDYMYQRGLIGLQGQRITLPDRAKVLLRGYRKPSAIR